MISEKLTNETIIKRFESDSIPDKSFRHADHVRLAFAYLSQYPVLQALEKFATVLKRFAAARSKPTLYNETITCAYFFLIRERMERGQNAAWEDFSRENPDLLIWKGGILTRYYHESTLQSNLARTVFVFPDKCV
jgi:hypothetical protein